MSVESLRGKVVAVTGGSSGIGLAVVRKLLAAGTKVAVADIAAEAPEVSTSPANIHRDYTFTKVDVTNSEAVQEWVQATAAHFGRLDAMVPNAGVSFDQDDSFDVKHLQRTLAVNVEGVWNCAAAAFHQFRKQGGPGSVCSTASVNGLRGQSKTAAYNASKHAVVGLTKSLALDWAPYGIRVNAVAPGITRTKMMERATLDKSILESVVGRTPQGRIGDPDELADSYLFLLADSASFITGTILTCDGGLSI